MQKPTGKRMAPIIGYPVWTLTITANAAASARIAPAMYARITVSRVDMNILDSPASTILVTNSEGTRYDIPASFFAGEFQASIKQMQRTCQQRAPVETAGNCRLSGLSASNCREFVQLHTGFAVKLRSARDVDAPAGLKNANWSRLKLQAFTAAAVTLISVGSMIAAAITSRHNPANACSMVTKPPCS